MEKRNNLCLFYKLIEAKKKSNDWNEKKKNKIKGLKRIKLRKWVLHFSIILIYKMNIFL